MWVIWLWVIWLFGDLLSSPQPSPKERERGRAHSYVIYMIFNVIPLVRWTALKFIALKIKEGFVQREQGSNPQVERVAASGSGCDEENLP